VQLDHHPGARIGYPVDVTRRGEGTHVTALFSFRARSVRAVPFSASANTCSYWGAFQDREGTSGDVVMNRGGLARPPDEGHDRERPVGLGMQQMRLIAGRAAQPFLLGQDFLWSQAGACASSATSRAVCCQSSCCRTAWRMPETSSAGQLALITEVVRNGDP
jgi:hypothetical protein